MYTLGVVEIGLGIIYLLITKKYNKKIITIIFSYIYFLILFIILFFRKKYEERIFSYGEYIIDWIKLLPKNKTIFINIVGNIILFIPIGFILYDINIKILKALIITIILTTIIELTQYITKRGIFDIIDIILNITGMINGYIIIKLIRKR